MTSVQQIKPTFNLIVSFWLALLCSTVSAQLSCPRNQHRFSGWVAQTVSWLYHGLACQETREVRAPTSWNFDTCVEDHCDEIGISEYGKWCHCMTWRTRTFEVWSYSTVGISVRFVLQSDSFLCSHFFLLSKSFYDFMFKWNSGWIGKRSGSNACLTKKTDTLSNTTGVLVLAVKLLGSHGENQVQSSINYARESSMIDV